MDLCYEACWGDVSPKLYTTFNARTYLCGPQKKEHPINALQPGSLEAITSNLITMASNPIAMASNLEEL